MDVSGFSGEEFDAVTWINRTFRSVHHKDKESRICSMVTKLQLYVEQADSALEETSHQVVQSMPETVHDMAAIGREALSLKDNMLHLKQQISKMEESGESSLRDLARLDHIKTELDRSRETLHQADKWTLLTASTEQLFEREKWEECLEVMSSMEECLEVLGKEERLQLETLRNRLEAALSPPLLKAFASSHLEECKRMVDMFERMGRRDEVARYYRRHAVARLLSKWSTIHPAASADILHSLDSYYDSLLTDYHSQAKWCLSVLKRCDVLVEVYAQVLEEGGVEAVAGAVEGALAPLQDPLPVLLSLHQATTRFTTNLDQALRHQGVWTSEGWRRVYCGAMKMYSGYMGRYSELEERHMTVELGSRRAAAEELSEAVHTLSQRNTAYAAFCRSALRRCLLFTRALAIHPLVRVLQFCLKKLLEEYRSATRRVREERDSADEWTVINTSLTLLHTFGEAVVEVREVDREAVEEVVRAWSVEAEESSLRSALLSSTPLQDPLPFVQLLKQGSVVSVVGEDVSGKVEEVGKEVYRSCVEVMWGRVAQLLSECCSVSWVAPAPAPHPDYTYAPLEHITQIGEYLMTLPQHMEALTGRGEDAAATAVVALVRHPTDTLAHCLLQDIARLTSSHLTDTVLSLPHLSHHSAKQLSIDIGYLENVLEDLGLSLSDSLSQMRDLLKLPAELYLEVAPTLGCPPRLVASVRHLRNITSS